MASILLPQVQLSFRQYLGLSLRFSLRTQPLTALTLLPGFAGLATIWLVATGPVPFIDLLRDNPLQMLLLIFCAFLPLITLWGIRQQYHNSGFLLEAPSYELTPEQLRVRSASLTTDLAWPAVPTAHLFGSWVLLQTSARTAFFLDLRRVQAPATPADVLALLRLQEVAVA